MKLSLRGTQFDVDVNDLHRLPDSKLGTLAKKYEDINNSQTTIYFNRNPRLFHNILDFYESGNLHFGSDTCAATIQQELEFWGIPEHCLSPCCHRRYTEQLQEDQARVEMLAKLLNCTQDPLVGPKDAGDSNSLRERAWRFLNDRDYCKAARVSRVHGALSGKKDKRLIKCSLSHKQNRKSIQCDFTGVVQY